MTEPERFSFWGKRARLGRSGPRPRGPLSMGQLVHWLVCSFAPVFGARARRTAAEAAAVPIISNRTVPTTSRPILPSLLIATSLACSTRAAVTLTTVHSFTGKDGAHPVGVL